jgi:hypothetical protein
MIDGRAIAISITLVLAACAGPPGGGTPTSPAGEHGQTGGELPLPAQGSPSPVPVVRESGKPVWLKCGAYAMPIPNQMAVQMIEQGIVWVAYSPALPEPQIEQLRTLIRGMKYVLLSPAPPEAELSTTIVATAREHQYKTENASDAGLAPFVERYAVGPQPPAPGAPCVSADVKLTQ